MRVLGECTNSTLLATRDALKTMRVAVCLMLSFYGVLGLMFVSDRISVHI